jgi:uncharacterized RDD family membrane protein YckC
MTAQYSLLDTAIRLETPEGTEIDVHPAGLYVRGLAFLIDELLRWTIIFAGFVLGGFAGYFGTGLALIIFFLTYWLYGVVFEVLNNGMTPGKKMRGLQVIHADGTPIRLPASMLRNLLLTIDFLPVVYLLGIVTMTLTPKFQRLGDLAADTLVTYLAKPQLDTDVDEGSASAITPPFPLTSEEQSVMVEFLERSDGLTDSRVNELARIVGDVFEVTAADAAEEAKRIASGLRGG